jgi:hypothetical protein
LEVPKKGPNFAQSTLFSRGVVLRQFWTQLSLGYLGIKEAIVGSSNNLLENQLQIITIPYSMESTRL